MASLSVSLTLIALLAGAVVNAKPSAGPPGDVLLRKEVIKKPCRYDRDCARHAYCKLQSECTCKEGFFIYKEDLSKSEVCLKRVMGLGDDCKESAQCQLALGPSAECRLGWDGSFCRCIDGTHEVDNYCYVTAKVGERCTVKNNCRIEGGPTLTCAAGVCVCPRLQHGSSDGLRCLDDKHLGEGCSEDDECITTNSMCSGRCKCRVSYVPDANREECLRVADNIGDMCTEDLQCNHFIPDSECNRHGECACIDGYHPGPQGVRCWRSSVLGESCVDHNECLDRPQPFPVPHNDTRAMCANNRCQCADGYEPDETGQYCKEGSAARPSLGAGVLLLAGAACLWARV